MPDIFIFIIRKKWWHLFEVMLFYVEPKLEMTQVLSAPQELHKMFEQKSELIEHVIMHIYT